MKNSLYYKTLSLLSLPLTIACGPTGPREDGPRFFKQPKAEAISTPTPQPTPAPIDATYFDRFGYVAETNGSGLMITIGDLDNDGDLDLIAMDSRGCVKLYENKIPQHNQSQTSATLESYK